MSRSEIIDKVYREQRTKLMSYALHLCQYHKEDAEDIIQQSVYRLMIAEGYYSEDDIRKMFRTTVHNVYVNYYLHRERNQGQWIFFDDMLTDERKEIDHLAAMSDQAFRDPAHVMTMEKFLEFDFLKIEGYRETARMRYALGADYIDIASATGVPVGTVRSRLHRANKEIKKQARLKELIP